MSNRNYDREIMTQNGTMISFDEKDFRILTRALELLYLTQGEVVDVSLILRSEFQMDSISVRGYVQTAFELKAGTAYVASEVIITRLERLERDRSS